MSALKTTKWYPLMSFSHPHITQSSLIHGQTHQSVVWGITASCLLVKGRWSHLKNTLVLVDFWQASEISHSKSSLGNFQHQCMSTLLVNVYSYRWMVKSVSCVHRKQLFSNPLTYADDALNIATDKLFLWYCVCVCMCVGGGGAYMHAWVYACGCAWPWVLWSCEWVFNIFARSKQHLLQHPTDHKF